MTPHDFATQSTGNWNLFARSNYHFVTRLFNLVYSVGYIIVHYGYIIVKTLHYLMLTLKNYVAKIMSFYSFRL